MPSQEFQPSRLGPYELQRPLGAGGMGEVFLALDTRLKREVAVKLLPPEVSRDAARVARFEREARLTSQLNHPNIVALYDVVHEDGVDGLVMELVRGESLREVLGRGAIPVRKTVTIASAIAEALAAAHAVGVVHRDLKPENVMLTREGSVKVLDFGLAREAVPLSTSSGSVTAVHLSQPGQVVGTAIYMSPEQASGEAVDFRSDQFSLGLVLYEMLAARHPFQRNTVTSTVAAILVEEPSPSIDSLPGNLPASVRKALRRCLQKEPRKRYGSTADLAHDLSDALEEIDSPAPTSVEPRRARWLRAAPWLLAIAALAVAAATLITLRAKPPKNDVPTVEAAIDLGDLAFPSAEVTGGLGISPNGRYLTLGVFDARGMSPLRIQDLQTGELRTLAQTRNVFASTWSPDGRSIAYLEDGKLKRIGMDGSPPVIICDARSEGVPNWQGDTILFPQFTPPAGVFAVSANGGAPRRVIKVEPDSGFAAFWPYLLPDGKRFFYLELSFGEGRIHAQRLMLASIDGGTPREVMKISSAAEFSNGYLLFVREGTLLAQPFDLKTARASGQSRPIARGVNYFSNTGGASFSVSQNGVLAWRKVRSPQPLLWFDRAGTVVSSIDPQAFAAPRIARDGKRFAVGVVNPDSGSSDIWVYAIETGNIEKVTFEGHDDKVPVWTHDGSGVFYRTDGHGPPDIAYRTVPPTSTQFVIADRGVQEPRDISPDGKLLIYIQSAPDTGVDLWITSVDGKGTRRVLVQTPFRDADARFSPDGRWIAYQSDVSGRPEIYLRGVEEGSRATIVSLGGGTLPRWSGSGRELFYYSAKETIMSVPVGPDGSVNPIDATALFHTDLATFEPMPDGSRFLVQPAEDTRVPVRVLSNWMARLGEE